MLFVSHFRPEGAEEIGHSRRLAWRIPLGLDSIFAQSLPSLGSRLHLRCDTCAVSPHQSGILTCPQHCRVAGAMAGQASPLDGS